MSCYKGKYHDELIANAAYLSLTSHPIIVVGEFMDKPLSSQVENVKSNRHVADELLSCHPPCALQFLGGVVFHQGNFFKRSTSDGTSFVDVMRNNGVRVGIQLDQGTVELPGTKGETTTEGLYLLAQRCQDCYYKGARFAKWCAVFKIGPDQPSQLAINENANGLARYAIICQENGLVPIVEPKILVDGSHDIDRCAQVTERVLAACYKALNDHRVLLEGTLLRCNMVTPGSKYSNKVPHQVIAEYTVRAIWRTVPVAVPGVVFLSGGQSKEEARLSLNEMNRSKKHPWKLSLSFGFTEQHGSLTSCLRKWVMMKNKVRHPLERGMDGQLHHLIFHLN